MNFAAMSLTSMVSRLRNCGISYDLHSEILDNPDLEWVGDMEP